DAEIICFEKKDRHVLKALEVLQEEVEKRSNIRLSVSQNWPRNNQPVIAVGMEGHTEKFPEKYRQIIAELPSVQKEGYQIAVDKESQSALIIGNDNRGMLYGIGKLLRKMEARPRQISVPDDLNIGSSPAYPIRGHQLGCRPKTNA